jgi:hypothetical protein
MPPTRKAYRRTEAGPSENSRSFNFPINPQNPKVYCLLCGNTGFRPITWRGSTAVVVCVCRGGKKESQPAGDFKSSAAGDR